MWASTLKVDGSKIVKESYSQLYKGNVMRITLEARDYYTWMLQSWIYKGKSPEIQYWHEIPYVGENAYTRGQEMVNFKMTELEIIVDRLFDTNKGGKL